MVSWRSFASPATEVCVDPLPQEVTTPSILPVFIYANTVEVFLFSKRSFTYFTKAQSSADLPSH